MNNSLESATLRSSTILNLRKKNNLPVYNGGLGANPLKQHSLLINTLKENAEKKEYIAPTGITKLNQQISKIYSTNNVLVGNGLKEMIFVLLLAWKYDVILVTPCWVSYIEQTKILNKTTHYIKTNIQNNFKLTPQLLEENIKKINKPKLLFLNNPTNPTGAVYSKEELISIAKICKKYDIVVFADEIYIDIVHNNNETVAFRNLYSKTISGSSLSKNFGCGGYRVGWLTFPDNLKDIYNQAHMISSSTYSCASHCLQEVAYQALLYPKDLEKFLFIQKFIFTEVAKVVFTKFNSIGIKTSRPEGAWYIFLDFNDFKNKLLEKNITNDQDLFISLINDIGLITVPGTSFGYNGLYLRYSIVDLYFEKNNCVEDLNKDDINIESLTKNILKGIDQLEKWLN